MQNINFDSFILEENIKYLIEFSNSVFGKNFNDEKCNEAVQCSNPRLRILIN